MTRLRVPCPTFPVQTDAAGAHIVKELGSQLAAAVSIAKPVRLVRQPSVIITEGDDIVSEEVVVIARRLPAVDNRVADAADTTVVPVRFWIGTCWSASWIVSGTTVSRFTASFATAWSR